MTGGKTGKKERNTYIYMYKTKVQTSQKTVSTCPKKTLSRYSSVVVSLSLLHLIFKGKKNQRKKEMKTK
jgi:hypothetical protein